MNGILIVDDDAFIRELVCALIRKEGFSTYEAQDGREALLRMKDIKPDLCIIDVMMPNMDGFELCRNIRKYYDDMPILMLTAEAELSQKVKGFELGTDDYLTKPFEAQELIVRVRALLRRYRISASDKLQIGNLTIDRNGYNVIINGESQDIPMKEFELLFKLASSPGKTFSRDQLIEDLWGYDFDGNERTLDVHIGRLRERFPCEQYNFKITTIRGLGYRLEVLS